MIAGKRYYSRGDEEVTERDKEEGKRFREILYDTVSLGGEKTILVDFIPFLRWIGFKGIEKSMVKLKEKREAFFQELIEQRRGFLIETGIDSNISTDENEGDGVRKKMIMIDVLLLLQQNEPDYYTDKMIQGLMGVRTTFKLVFLSCNFQKNSYTLVSIPVSTYHIYLRPRSNYQFGWSINT
ncbi:hypothetical protein MKX03_033517 [Papaver bracteatum]|nr:hypothetical protein MKX03_033517 [Papaver bracteatum]